MYHYSYSYMIGFVVHIFLFDKFDCVRRRLLEPFEPWDIQPPNPTMRTSPFVRRLWINWSPMILNVAMYFDVQSVIQELSPLDNELPGLDMHASKHVILTFCEIKAVR